MQIRPTPITAALAGLFSAVTWPWIWPLVHSPAPESTALLIVGLLACIAVPAHAFVLGFHRTAPGGGTRLDVPLLKRIAAWLAGGATGAVLIAFL